MAGQRALWFPSEPSSGTCWMSVTKHGGGGGSGLTTRAGVQSFLLWGFRYVGSPRTALSQQAGGSPSIQAVRAGHGCSSSGVHLNKNLSELLCRRPSVAVPPPPPRNPPRTGAPQGLGLYSHVQGQAPSGPKQMCELMEYVKWIVSPEPHGRGMPPAE